MDGFTGPFIFKRNFTYDSKFKFEVIAPYSWWGDVTNQANLFYEVQGADEEYFGNRPSEGNICIGKGPNNPDIKFKTDYEKMIHLLQDYEWNYPGKLPGIDNLNVTLDKVLKDFKE